jgi:asparagine synthase (glutamine-hydrolysing)
MGEALKFRGPDEETTYQDDYLSFIFRRLSIVVLEGGSQPIWNEDKSIFGAVNGEIYNHLELRDLLEEQDTFKIRSDSEIILHLYQELGSPVFEKLHGMFMFAIVLWDIKKGELILCRDRLGIKPLYYIQTKDGFLLGSELKSILQHPSCPKQINWANLDTPGLQDGTLIPS